MAANIRYLWQPGTTLCTRFLGGDPAVRKKVEHYAHQWKQYANIKFKFVEAGSAQIRISFAENSGSWSWLGTRSLIWSDEQIPTMNFGWLSPDSDETEYTGVVLHEFGHALGCIHEHQHPENGIPWNREKAYAYYAQQGWTRAEIDTQVFQRYSTTVTQFSQCDSTSIMMYPIPQEITTDNFTVGWNRELSATDKEFIGKLYPFA